MQKIYLLSLIMLLALALFGCKSSLEDEGKNDLSDAGDAVSDDDDSQEEPAKFTHEIFTHTTEVEIKKAATGSFEIPSLSYPPIPVNKKYKHLINFDIDHFMPPFRKPIPTHGPLVLYSEEGETIVFSPMDSFFTSLVEFKEGKIHYGVVGEVDTIPKGFKHRFIMIEGKGIFNTIMHWGDLMLADRGKSRLDLYADEGVSYLGYWTDNGTKYYYNTEPEMNEHETLLAVKADLDKNGIPVKYMQLDSWWYFKDPGFGLSKSTGLILWEPQPEMFPEGLAAFQKELGLPLILHNRYFSPNSEYHKRYKFYDDKIMSLPLERGVFDEFMQNAVEWGVITYEQDWLVTQYEEIAHLRNGIGNAEAWMKNMHDAVKEKNLTMQLCMGSAANLMDSLDRSAITSIRTSNDAFPHSSKETYWPVFHTVNMLAWALGILPFKDNFHSSEKFGEAEALVTALSAGMAGLGDAIGAFKKEIIMGLCREDGLLLKPDRPAVPIEAMFFEHERPFTAHTYKEVEGVGKWVYAAAFHIAEKHEQRNAKDKGIAQIALNGRDLNDVFVWPDGVYNWNLDLKKELGVNGKVALYDWRAQTAKVVEGKIKLEPFEDLYSHRYYALCPIFENGLSLIGETDKYITVANGRVEGIAVDEKGITVKVKGAPGERVEMRAFDTIANKMLEPSSAEIDGEGNAQIKFSINR